MESDSVFKVGFSTEVQIGSAYQAVIEVQVWDP